MTSNRWHIGGCLAALLVSCLATQVSAQEKRPVMALNHCAAYGPDFVPVEGTRTCERIGRHVRVEIGGRPLTPPAEHFSGGGTAPAAVRTEEPLDGASDFPSADHLRLRQDSDPYGGFYAR